MRVNFHELLTVDVDHELLVVALVLRVLVQLCVLGVDGVHSFAVHCEHKLDLVFVELVVSECLPVDI